jgi:hypothetical protein
LGRLHRLHMVVKAGISQGKRVLLDSVAN